jgi:hypothetical protein
MLNLVASKMVAYHATRVPLIHDDFRNQEAR